MTVDDTISRQAAIDAVHKSIFDFFDICDDDEESPMTYQDERLLELNKAITTRIKAVPSAQPEPQWIPCSERLPEEDYWLGGSGKQFSENVMVTIVNRSEEDTWVDMSYTVDGEWVLELPRYCEIIAWMPQFKPYKESEE